MGRTVGPRLRFKARPKVEDRFHDGPSGRSRGCRRGWCIRCLKGCRGGCCGCCHRRYSIDQLMVVMVMDVVQRLKSLRLQRGRLQRGTGTGSLLN